jgi:hypothetical protein
MMGSSRGRMLPMMFMLLAIVVAMVAIGAALGASSMAVAAPKTTGATIEATSFQVANGQTGEESAVCPGNKRALGGGVVEVGPPAFMCAQAARWTIPEPPPRPRAATSPSSGMQR